ncbi:nodulation protein NfeD [Robbsia andropogonis]|uniref:Nodulation protein NfeD n=1 Tax=Robbsia andropogonis TaxID=28092 RepID=A0A0F5K3L9_9BURK|nr:LysR family transcriptional regulator [Robbsia andropogonis]KKB64683.1 nodulation protein NfeD [Robbsia andropogonis]
MRFSKLDLNLLVALDALLTEGSISRAAEKIHLSQSAMSNALARLREYFDDDLLVQVGRKMEPTSRAEGLKDPVRDILLRVDATVAAQPQFVPSQSNRLFGLLVSDYTMMTLMPHVLKRAYREAPGVSFDLRPQVSNPQRVLERGEADLQIIPKDFCSTEHPSERLLEETFCCVLWEQSNFATGDMTSDRYLRAGHVVVHPGGGGIALEDAFMRRLGVSRRVEASTFSFLSAAHLVVGTHRIATMHSRLAREAARALPIAIRDMPMVMPKMEQCMQWHKHRTSDQGIAWLRMLIRESVLAMDGMLDAV